MYWILLLIAGVLEVGWAVGLRYSNGLTNIPITILTVIGYVLCLYFLALAVKGIPLGTAYAVWTGIGTVGTVILGIILFKEPVSVMRLVCILLIVSGIAGLKLLSSN